MQRRTQNILLFIILLLSLVYIIFWSQLTSSVKNSITKELDNRDKAYQFKYDDISVVGFHKNLSIKIKKLHLIDTKSPNSQTLINLGDFEVICDLFKDICKINLGKKITFGKFDREMEFNNPPKITLSFRENLLLNELKSKDYTLLEILNGASFEDNGYKLINLKNGEEIFISNRGSADIEISKDDKDVTLIAARASSEGEEAGAVKHGLGKTSSKMGYHLVISPDKFSATLDTFELATSSFSILSNGTFSSEKFSNKYDVDFKIKGLSGFNNYINSSLPQHSSVVKPILLKISGNEVNSNVEDIEFKVKSDPLSGAPIIGNLQLNSLMAFYLELVKKDTNPNGP